MNQSTTPQEVKHHLADVLGMRTSYYTTGHPGRRTVLLLHDGAWGADALVSWSSVMTELASDHWVVAPDLLGFGQTDKVVMLGSSPYELRIRHIAAFIAQLVPQDPIHVIGTSFGGSLALRAAIADAWPVASVVSVGGTGGPWRRDISKRLLADLEPGREYIEQVVQVLANTTDHLDEQIDRRYRNSLDPGHYAAMVSPRLTHPAAKREAFTDDYPAALKNVSIPVSIITPRDDQLVEENWARHVQTVAPDVAFYEMDGPHSPNITHPKELSDLLRRVLAAAETRASTELAI